MLPNVILLILTYCRWIFGILFQSSVENQINLKCSPVSFLIKTNHLYVWISRNQWKTQQRYGLLQYIIQEKGHCIEKSRIQRFSHPTYSPHFSESDLLPYSFNNLGNSFNNETEFQICFTISVTLNNQISCGMRSLNYIKQIRPGVLLNIVKQIIDEISNWFSTNEVQMKIDTQSLLFSKGLKIVKTKPLQLLGIIADDNLPSFE